MIVDDEPIIREGLRVLIDWRQYGFEICGEAGNGREALELVKELEPNLMVVDVKMPVIDGLKLMELVRQIEPTIQFLVLSGYSEFAYAQRAIDLGALGYLLKPIDQRELTRKVNKAHQVLQRLYNTQTDRAILEICWGDAEQELVKQLCMAVEFGNQKQIATLVAEVADRYCAGSISMAKAASTYLHIYFAVIRSLKVAERLKGQTNSYEEIVDRAFACTGRAALEELFRQKLADLSRQLMLSSPDELVARIMSYVELNYAERLTLEELAAIVGYTPAYLGKLFRSHTGIGFADFLGKIRLEKAKELLEAGTNVSEVAEQVGYRDADYFNRKFKQRFGANPSAFKKK